MRIYRLITLPTFVVCFSFRSALVNLNVLLLVHAESVTQPPPLDSSTRADRHCNSQSMWFIENRKGNTISKTLYIDRAGRCSYTHVQFVNPAVFCKAPSSGGGG